LDAFRDPRTCKLPSANTFVAVKLKLEKSGIFPPEDKIVLTLTKDAQHVTRYEVDCPEWLKSNPKH
jgi:DUF1680 family protein